MTQNVEPLRRNTIPCCVIARASLLAVIRLLRDVLRAHARAFPHALADLPPLPVRFLRFPDLFLALLFGHDGFVENKNFSGILPLQRQILLDYEEDITKYAGGLDKTKILNAYRKIPVFLGNENKKFQISKIAHGARNREYIGVIDWLVNAGIVNISYCMEQCSLPLKGNYNPDNYRLYFADTGLLIGSLDEEVQMDLRNNENLNTYKGALYENIISDMLVKAGFDLYFYKDDSKKIEMDFFVRDTTSLIPIEVKANDNATISLNQLINSNQYKDIKYGIKLCNKNIGFNGKFYTFPYFLTFLLKRYLKEKNEGEQ